MSLYLYNTMTRQKERFEPQEDGVVKMYVCGPTVYSDAHIGHAMSAVVFDVIRRYLEHLDYRVNHVMNYTDVDDKIIQRANEQKVSPFDLANSYINEFDRQLEQLNVLPAHHKPRVSGTIEQIIEMVDRLVESNHAYAQGGDVYFRVKAFAGYGRLSRRNLADMEAQASAEREDIKEAQLDFALWKGAKPGEPYWESPWGRGRPGWHIECSAMNLAHLGEQIDIHGGGNDLVFPHHENEIAQTESVTGKPFARYWMHNGMLQLAGTKMSKSLGNMVTIDEFLAEHDSDTFRMITLNASYRKPLLFSDDTVHQARRGLERIAAALRPLGSGEIFVASNTYAKHPGLDAINQGFHEAMNDDFNTAGALARLFELVRLINQAREGQGDVTVEEGQAGQALLRDLGGILGLQLEEPAESPAHDADPFIDLLVETRSEIRRQKLWALADKLRDQLAELGVTVEDGKEGSSWHWGNG